MYMCVYIYIHPQLTQDFTGPEQIQQTATKRPFRLAPKATKTAAAEETVNLEKNDRRPAEQCWKTFVTFHYPPEV